jgi:hypothetical protein
MNFVVALSGLVLTRTVREGHVDIFLKNGSA